MTLPWPFTNPGIMIGVTVAVPFLARFLVAGIVQGRVMGTLPGYAGLDRNALKREDFPPPNDVVKEFAVAATVFALGLIAGSWLTTVLSLPQSPWWAAPYFVVTIPSVIWLFRRVKADDQRSLDLRMQRDAQKEMRRFNEEAAKDHLW